MSDREWLYAALGFAAGIGLMRAAGLGRRVEPGERVLLVGDEHALGLGPQLRALGRDRRVEVDWLGAAGSTVEQWAGSKKLGERLSGYRPDLVLVSLGTADRAECPGRLERSVSALVSRLPDRHGWIGPPARTPVGARIRSRVGAPRYLGSDALQVPRGPAGGPTARAYAGWAGNVWRRIS